jgi:hypothetical protein
MRQARVLQTKEQAARHLRQLAVARAFIQWQGGRAVRAATRRGTARAEAAGSSVTADDEDPPDADGEPDDVAHAPSGASTAGAEAAAATRVQAAVRARAARVSVENAKQAMRAGTARAHEQFDALVRGTRQVWLGKAGALQSAAPLAAPHEAGSDAAPNGAPNGGVLGTSRETANPRGAGAADEQPERVLVGSEKKSSQSSQVGCEKANAQQAGEADAVRPASPDRRVRFAAPTTGDASTEPSREQQATPPSHKGPCPFALSLMVSGCMRGPHSW